jgi:hypothetical protein
MSVGLPKVDDMALADLVKSSQPFSFCDPLDHDNCAAKLLPAVRLGTMTDVAMRQTTNLVSQGSCW